MSRSRNAKRELHSLLTSDDIQDAYLSEHLQILRGSAALVLLDTKNGFEAALDRIKRVQSNGNVRTDPNAQEVVSLILKFMPCKFSDFMMDHVRGSDYVATLCRFLDEVVIEKMNDRRATLIHTLLQALRDVFDAKGGREHSLSCAMSSLVQASISALDVMVRRDCVDTLLHLISCCRIAKERFLDQNRWKSSRGRIFTDVLPTCGDLATQMHILEILLRTVRDSTYEGLELLPQGKASRLFHSFATKWARKKLVEEDFYRGIKKLAVCYNDSMPLTRQRVYSCRAVAAFSRLKRGKQEPGSCTILRQHMVDFGPTHLCLYSSESELGIKPLLEDQAPSDLECSIYVRYDTIIHLLAREDKHTIYIRVDDSLSIYPGDEKVPKQVFDHEDPNHFLLIKLGKNEMDKFLSTRKHVIESFMKPKIPHSKPGEQSLLHEKSSMTELLALPACSNSFKSSKKPSRELREFLKTRSKTPADVKMQRKKMDVICSSQDCETRCVDSLWSEDCLLPSTELPKEGSHQEADVGSKLFPQIEQVGNQVHHTPQPLKKTSSQLQLAVAAPRKVTTLKPSKNDFKPCVPESTPPGTEAANRIHQRKADNQEIQSTREKRSHGPTSSLTIPEKMVKSKQISKLMDKAKRQYEKLKTLDAALAMSNEKQQEAGTYTNGSKPEKWKATFQEAGDLQFNKYSSDYTKPEGKKDPGLSVSDSLHTVPESPSIRASPTVLCRSRKRLFAEPCETSPWIVDPSPKRLKTAKIARQNQRTVERAPSFQTSDLMETCSQTQQGSDPAEDKQESEMEAPLEPWLMEGTSFFKEFLKENRRIVDTEIRSHLADASRFIDVVLKKLEDFSSTHMRKQQCWTKKRLEVHAKKMDARAASVKKMNCAMQSELSKQISTYQALTKEIPLLQAEAETRIQQMEERNGAVIYEIEKQARNRLSFYGRKIALAKAERKFLLG